MSELTAKDSRPSSADSPIERAITYGIDISLLAENLRLSPTERLRRGEQFLRSVIAFKNEVVRARQAQADQP